jgi:ABC-2 type transport system permease protein
MKLRVLRNSLRGRQVAALIAGGMIGLLFAGSNLVLALYPFPDSGISVDLLAAIYAVWLAGWVLAPIATGGGDDTLRAEHFTLLPLTGRQLARGLLAASFVGVPAVVTLIAFGGLLLFGLRFSGQAAFVGVIFAALQLALVVLVYRLAIAGLGSLLTSRKGKELGILLTALTGLSGVAINFAVNSLGPALVNGQAPGLATTVRVLPSGWGAQAVDAAGGGRWGTVALLLVAMLALLAVLVVAWGALLVRTVTRGPFRGTAKAGPTRTTSRRRALLPATPVGAVAAKELRTWWRDARRRIALFSTVILAVVVAVVPALSAGTTPRTLPYLALFVVVAACMQTGNLYGMDGSALWHTLVTPGAPRADVRGRQLAWFLLVGPLALVLAVVLPAVTGRTVLYPWLLSLVPAMLGAGAGVVLLQSVYVAFALPDQRRNASPFSSGGRPGCGRVLLIFGLTALLAVSALPVAGLELAGTLTDQPVLNWAGVPLGIALGAVLAWWWGRVALNRLRDRGPELLQTVSKER